MFEDTGLALSYKQRVFLLFYLFPVIVGTILGVGMATWVFMAFGGGIWFITLLAGFFSTVWLLIYEEVMYDG